MLELDPLIAGPMTNADIANIAVNTPSAIAGARQVPNRRRKRSSIGTDASSPTAPNRAVPPAPASTAVPASSPMWCNTGGAMPTMPPTTPVIEPHSRRTRPGVAGTIAPTAKPCVAVDGDSGSL